MQQKLNIVIVGGGIGGLAAAIALGLAGHYVKVLEQQERIEEIGAGLQLSANATRILIKWGIDKAIFKDVVEPFNCVMRRWQDGRQIARLALHSYHREAYRAPFWDIHRHDLIQALYSRALKAGAEIKVNSKVVDIDFDTGTVMVQDGTVYEAHLVVGADGLNSLCRQKLVPTEDPEYTGDIAFRVLLNVADLPEDPDFQTLVMTPEVTYWLGPSGHAIVYVLKGGKQINMVAIAPDDLPSGVIRAPCSVAEALSKFDNWDPLLRKILSSANQTIYKWKLHKRPELDVWNHPSGRFTLLGDAVHPTLPYLSQGAAITIEDAAVLASCLSSPSELSSGLERYEALRRPRTSAIVRAATGQQYWYHLHDGPEQERRDSIMGNPKSEEGDPFLWREPTFAPWLYGYDAEKIVEGEEGEKLVGEVR